MKVIRIEATKAGMLVCMEAFLYQLQFAVMSDDVLFIGLPKFNEIAVFALMVKVMSENIGDIFGYSVKDSRKMDGQDEKH